ncbi:hypothetical protein [Arthrobacter sp. NPDC090010]|uniref:hypothetical protein n=1 Tax=Arthrobacter sp. NPDC090010 TaxID=3363942 RepID=UPI00382BC7B9
MNISQQFANYVPFGMALAGAAIVFLVLRYLASDGREGTSTTTAAKHSLTVGVLGWMASSLQPASSFGRLPSGASDPLTSPWALFLPVILVLGIHALGQLSYPGDRRTVRIAEVQRRTVQDFLPRRLAVVTALVFLVSLGLILSIVGLAGMPAGENPSPSAVPAPGLLPGAVTAAWLGSAWLALATGTVAVLLLIAHRRQLTGLGPEENAVLRTLSMNRLLRTSATIASGLAAIATGLNLLPLPGQASGTGINVGGAFNLLVLIVMWRWPAASRTAERQTPSDPALRWHRLAVLPAVPLGILTALALSGSLLLSGSGLQQAIILAGAGVLHLLWNCWCATRIPRVEDAGPVRMPLPRRSTLATALLCGFTSLFTLAGAFWTTLSNEGPHNERATASTVVVGVSILALLGSALLAARMTARHTLQAALPASEPAGLLQERWQRMALWTGSILLGLSALLLFQLLLPVRISDGYEEGGRSIVIVNVMGFVSPLMLLLAVLLWALSGVDPAPRKKMSPDLEPQRA